MDYRGNGRNWQDVATYSPDQVEYVLNEIGIEIESETESAFLCFCPYHGNKYTPSFAVSNTEGMFICFNQSCAETGSLKDLIKHTTGRDEYRALRLIAQSKIESSLSVGDRIKKIMDRGELKEFPQWLLDKQYKAFWDSQEAQSYMKERGFDTETVRDFKIGYDPEEKDPRWPHPPLVTVPMHSIDGKPIGLIGRSILPNDKSFKNSKALPKNRSLWNIHRAKRQGDVVIVCEASFDAMRIHQAGYPNVVAVLGGSFSDYHQEQLERHFNTVLVMTDYDDKEKHRQLNCKKCQRNGFKSCQGHNPGRALGEKIAASMKGKSIRWAYYGDGLIYPAGAKDAGDCSDEQIKSMIKGSISNYEYHQMGFDQA